MSPKSAYDHIIEGRIITDKEYIILKEAQEILNNYLNYGSLTIEQMIEDYRHYNDYI